ncbi:ATP-binding protein [Geodermatophilus sp. SYSU D00758]
MSIRTPDQRLRVFVSSTMQELAAERVAVRAAVERLRLTPVLFELGARPHPPRELYLAYLEQSHVFVALYWQQYGWVAPGQGLSGLEDEYLAAEGKPKLVYLKTPAPDRDPRLSAMIDRIRSDGLSYRSFATADELTALVADDLAVLLSERFDAPEPPAEGEPAVTWQLPAPVSSLIGRQREVARLRELLTEPATRLVTLVGPGGIGKTRLAMHVAGEVRGAFPDGVAAVPLDAVRSPDRVAGTVATALGLVEEGGRSPRRALAAFLGPRRVLLVLDNLEQVVGAAPLITELLSAAGGLTVLATSREVLHLTGEHVLVVPALQTAGPGAPIRAAVASEAVRLFLDRARAARADLDLDGPQLQAVVDICRRLDGLPLAIELAAARVRLLEPAEMLRRLDSRLAVLTGGPRDLPERQRTIRRTLEWSHDLLDDDEKVVFARLAVFVGGFSLAAAESVCGDRRVPDPVAAVGSLVDKSLVRPEHTAPGGPRLAMLDTVREFALERLVAGGEAERIHAAHAAFFRALASRIEPTDREPLGASSAGYLADAANFDAAMRTLLDRDRAAAAGLARSLWQFWWVHGLFSRGIGWMDELLAHGSELPDPVRADAFLVLGMLAFGQGDGGRARPALQTAAELYRGLGDRRSSALAQIPLGLLVAGTDPGAGEEMLASAVAAFRQLDEPWGLAFALLSLGGAALFRDEPDEAVPLLEESVALARRSGTEVFLGNALVNLGLARTARGDLDGAAQVLREALGHGRATGSRETVARALDGLASVALASADPDGAARLTGAADGIRRSIAAAVFPTDRPVRARTRAALDDRWGEAGSAARIEAEAGRPLADLLTTDW